MKQDELIEHIEKYFLTKEKIKEIREMVVPPFIEKPIAAKADAWNKYLKKKTEYDQAVFLKGEGLQEQECTLLECRKHIVMMLPCSNMWFVTDNEKYAVAHQSDDWPGSDGNLLIEVDPKVNELREVHHQIIN